MAKSPALEEEISSKEAGTDVVQDEEEEGTRVFSLDQLAQHFKDSDPNKTVLLQGNDGKTRVFVHPDNKSFSNKYEGGRSFEDLGDVKDAKLIEYELTLRLHKDTIEAIKNPGEKLSPAFPAITYHNHVWWFWGFEIELVDGEDPMITISLKSVGPKLNKTQLLNPGALAENVPRTQLSPKLVNPTIKLPNGKSAMLHRVLAAQDCSYTANAFVSLDEFKEFFTDESPIIDLTVVVQIPTSYFDYRVLAGLDIEDEAAKVALVQSSAVAQVLPKIIAGERVRGADYALTFGNSGKNESKEFFVHRLALAKSSFLFAKIFEERFNPPGSQIIVPSAEDRFIFPHVLPTDAEFFLTYFYTQRVTLPDYGSFARVGRLFCAFADQNQVMILFKQWQKLIIQRVIEARDSGDGDRVVKEAVGALVAIYSAPYGALPVAKRVAVSVLANEVNRQAAEDVDLIAKIHKDERFSAFNLDKFLPCVARYHYLIGAVAKRGIK